MNSNHVVLKAFRFGSSTRGVRIEQQLSEPRSRSPPPSCCLCNIAANTHFLQTAGLPGVSNAAAVHRRRRAVLFV